MRENELSAWEQWEHRDQFDVRLDHNGDAGSMVHPSSDSFMWWVTTPDGHAIARGRASTLAKAREYADTCARRLGWVLR